MTFEQVEKTFYEEHFKEHLDAQNEKYRAQRHYERMKNMDEYRTARRTCPEETILAIGNKDEYIPPKTLMAICTEFMNWEQRTYPGLHILNFSLHNDERGCGHIGVAGSIQTERVMKRFLKKKCLNGLAFRSYIPKKHVADITIENKYLVCRKEKNSLIYAGNTGWILLWKDNPGNGANQDSN